MPLLESILDRRRLILTVAALVSLTGLFAWLTMNRQEDPRMPAYWGQVVVVFPGADAEMVERLVLEPIEDALAEVEEIKTLESTAHAETAVLQIDLEETTRDTKKAWDDVRRALAVARLEFPLGVREPVLNDSLNRDHDAVVVAITGSADPLVLLDGARRVRKALLDIPDVAKIKILGDPGEQVTVEVDDAVARRLGLTADAIAAQLAERTRILPGGSLALGERTVRLRPLSEYETVEEIAASAIRLPSGATVPLGEVTTVRIGPAEPTGERMRLDGEMAVGLGIVAEEHAHAVRFGERVRERIDAVAPGLSPLEVRIVTFQPERVSTRLAQLNDSLLMGILIVAGVVVLAMGLRLGLVVASVVPLVTFASLAVFAIGGGVLHQISIAALVLALGMLVDNAIVIAENIQYRLDQGEARRAAAAAAVRELAVPLAAATGTTIAAFLPMFLARSGTADFTRSIPIMVMLTLTISYLFAVFVTPILSEMSLVAGRSRATAFTNRVAAILADLALRKTGVVLVAATALVTASLVGSAFVRQQFFPAADRNQFVVDLKLPEGAHLDSTDDASRALERLLLGREEVASVAGFVGRSAPRFYYNIESVPWSPHFAQLIVNTRTTADVDPTLEWLRQEVRNELPGVEVIAKRLEQGPPVGAPVQVRVFSQDPGDLQTAVTAIASQLREIPGTADVRNNLGAGEPTLRFRIDDAAAARHGLSRADVGRALAGHTRGLSVGELRSSDDPVPIVVRSRAGERLPAEALETLDVGAPDGSSVPLAQVARIDAGWRPAVIHHRNRARVATVSSQIVGEATFSDVFADLEPRLETLALPAGVRVSFGGDAEGSGEANSAMLRTVPIGILVLLGVLMAEFNSFRRVGLVLVTVPLAATGVIPGLLVADQPFGFMSLLGVFALVGIVVNNAIVLLEVVEKERREGAAVDDALDAAIRQRIRPILLTSATTVAGLLPLAFSQSTLWPPLAWAMISGLLASTALTLVVIPALYRVVFGSRREAGISVPTPATAALGATIAALVLAGSAEAQRAVTLEEALRAGSQRPAASAAQSRAEAVRQSGLAQRRASYLPVLGTGYTESDRDRDLVLETPLGSFELGASRASAAGVELTQPLFDPSRVLHGNAATRLETTAAELSAVRMGDILAAQAGEAYLDVLALEARLGSTRAFADSLEARLAETRARVEAGSALEADALKIRLALESARLDLIGLEQALDVARSDLGRSLGEMVQLDAAPAPDWVTRSVPGIEETISVAVASRPDLGALESSSGALDRRRAAVRAELIPRVDAKLAYTWSDGTPYAESSWVEGAIVVTWSPFVAGTRAPRAASISAEGDATRADLVEAKRGVEVEVRQAIARLVTAREAVTVSSRGVEQASETVRVERERNSAGRSTTNDLLEAEAQLRDQRTRLEVARLEVVRAWLRLWLARGGGDLDALVAG
jgi:multidrug efflux pump subunit AcrB/outer membrane protein TolC